jgi:hypothetical protein
MPISKASSNAVAPAAKGDLVVGTTTNDSGILGVGSNGETLVADSSQTTGLRYNPPVGSLANPIINGGLDIWQRGTSFTAGSVMTADRWRSYRGSDVAGATISRQTATDATLLPNIQYSIRTQRDSGNSATNSMNLAQSLETVNSIPFAGKSLTVTFYAKKGANFSAASDLLTLRFVSGTGTDQAINGTYTGAVTTEGTFTLTADWQRFALNVSAPTTMNEFALRFFYTPVGTAGANDWFEVTGVQVDLGTWTASTAPTFRRSGGTLAGELCAAQRYYWRTTGQAYTPSAIGMTQTTTTSTLYVTHPVPMRVAPTSIDFSNLEVTDLYDYGKAISSLVIESGSNGTNTSRLAATHATGATQYRPAFIRNANNSAGYIGFSAEL